MRSGIVEDEHAKLIRQHVKTTVGDCYQVAIILLKQDCLSHQQFAGKFGPQLQEVVECAVKLAISIKEEIVTKNFVSSFPRSCDPFDNDTMEAEEGEGTSEDIVGCTIRLGMQYTYRPSKESTAVARKVFAKAQVVTEGSLREMGTPSDE